MCSWPTNLLSRNNLESSLVVCSDINSSNASHPSNLSLSSRPAQLERPSEKQHQEEEVPQLQLRIKIINTFAQISTIQQQQQSIQVVFFSSWLYLDVILLWNLENCDKTIKLMLKVKLFNNYSFPFYFSLLSISPSTLTFPFHSNSIQPRKQCEIISNPLPSTMFHTFRVWLINRTCLWLALNYTVQFIQSTYIVVQKQSAHV